MSAPMPVVILISGRGSNLQAIMQAVQSGQVPIHIAAVISSNPQAEGLSLAASANLCTQIVDHRAYPTREGFDQALMQAIDVHTPGLVILAGFMRILGTVFINHYAGRLVNIHPSLLPAFKGLNTHTRALQAGVKEHGASVHFVTPDVDAGPIIAQVRVPVQANDTPETLGQRVLQAEHYLYPRAIRWFAEGRLRVHAGRVLLDGNHHPDQNIDLSTNVSDTGVHRPGKHA